MNSLKLILAVIFGISCLGIAGLYAQPPTRFPEGKDKEDWDEPLVPPPITTTVPQTEDYELWVPPIPDPSVDKLPPVSPQSWPLPEGIKEERNVTEEFVPGTVDPVGASEKNVIAISVARLYVHQYGNMRGATWMGDSLSLYIMGLGNIRLVEYVWNPGVGWKLHDQISLYNPGPTRWSKKWFYADANGWYALRAYVGAIASNWVYIYVY